MSYICDLHIHSKYSRATSKDMDIENLTKWAKIKGVNLLGTGDFTHPEWVKELKDKLVPAEDGVFESDGIKYILSAEVCSIYFKAGKTRKIHNIILAPDFKAVEEINKLLSTHGNLASDGRPILDFDSAKMAKAIFKINPDCLIIPAHIWTPHFSLFGANSGFDKIEECFEEEAENIYSLETGLSSDPAMNWRWSGLDRLTLTSNSDAHSPSKIGREANVFNSPFNYKELKEILKTKDSSRFLYTLEFFPEEGKYHWDGHRACSQRLSPDESKKVNMRCPTCGKKLTIGVVHRVENLGDRGAGFVPPKGPGFKNIVPLVEIISASINVGPESVSVQREYNKLIKNFGTEFNILLEVPKEDILESAPPKIAKGILKMRESKIKVVPGYDGVYGKVSIFDAEDEEDKKQLTFF